MKFLVLANTEGAVLLLGKHQKTLLFSFIEIGLCLQVVLRYAHLTFFFFFFFFTYCFAFPAIYFLPKVKLLPSTLFWFQVRSMNCGSCSSFAF